MMEDNNNSGIPAGLVLYRALPVDSVAVTAMAWVSGMPLIVSGGADKTLKTWNIDTGEVVRTFRGHGDWITAVSVTPDGSKLISTSFDLNVILWDLNTGAMLRRMVGHRSTVWSVALSPDASTAVSCSSDKSIKTWDLDTGSEIHTFAGHSAAVRGVAFTPDGEHIVSCSDDSTIRIWHSKTGSELRVLRGHKDAVKSIIVSPDGRLVISCSKDRTLILWDFSTGRQLRTLEGHTGSVAALTTCWRKNLLASKSTTDHTVRFWDCQSWEEIGVLSEKANVREIVNIAFDPINSKLATLGKNDTIIRLWTVDRESLVSDIEDSVQYANAKVVLVGDTGVGKSGLGLVLTGQSFKPTESTHGRHVWLFDTNISKIESNREETRETLLWDLAGQPGYRLVHQLHLDEVAVALVVFDSRSEINPFSGVRHWVKALRQSVKIQGKAALPMKKLLVSARVDRGGVGVSQERLQNFIKEHSFDAFFETSSKEGWGIEELASCIRESINWDSLPRVSSNELFQNIKEYLVAQKKQGKILISVTELYAGFLTSFRNLKDSSKLRAQFDTCIGRVEARDLIRRLRFGNLVLLQPELLDSYASAMVNAAKDEPDGLGSISEKIARQAEFRMSQDERVSDKEDENLLLIATIEDLLRREIVLRENTSEGPLLVFPTQFTRDWKEAPNPPGRSVVYTFEGPVLNLYATLAVRLSHSGLFHRKEMWRNAAVYSTNVGGTYGIFLREFGEGEGEITIFFGDNASIEAKSHFEEFVSTHLRYRVVPETLRKRRVLTCPECGEVIGLRSIELRRNRGFDWISCIICEQRISLTAADQLLPVEASLSEEYSALHEFADYARDKSSNALVLQGKMATQDYDVFLCYNREDKSQIIAIGNALKEHGILPWLDEWQLRPGFSWQHELESQIANVRSAAVFIGKSGIGPWQQIELEAFLREFHERGCPVIPVLLQNDNEAEGTKPKLPIFIKGNTWVDFSQSDQNPIGKLIWGITGKKDYLP